MKSYKAKTIKSGSGEGGPLANSAGVSSLQPDVAVLAPAASPGVLDLPFGGGRTHYDDCVVEGSSALA